MQWTTASWPPPSSTSPPARPSAWRPRKDVPHAGRDDDPIEFWKDWTDEALFTCTPVTVDIPMEDLPGPPVRSVECDSCGESVKDHREVVVDGKTLCRSCAGDSYYEV